MYKYKQKCTLPFPRAQNDLNKSSVEQSGAILWNNLPEVLKVIENKLSFKLSLNKKSKCSNDPYSPDLQDFFEVISLTKSVNKKT